MQPSQIAPPPWFLTGEGTVLVYHFPEKFSRKSGFMADYQQQAYRGWIGAVLLVDYRESNVGPYQELLFIPGLFDFAGKLAFSVSKIHVSTYSSGWNGLENWGIPKEQADFALTRDGAGNREFEVYAGSQLIFRASHKPVGPSFPLTSTFIPLTRLVQRLRGHLLETKLGVSGTAQWTSLKEIAVHPSFFPPVDRLTPLATLSLQNFRMVFSAPTLLPRVNSELNRSQEVG